jgi:hypothetical protein
MFATDEETALKGFLDEEVRCEGGVDKASHAADIYAKFTCDYCDDVLVGPVCNECHQELLAIVIQLGGSPCFTCHKLSAIHCYTVIGPVR